jgi:hypothetical protein
MLNSITFVFSNVSSKGVPSIETVIVYLETDPKILSFTFWTSSVPFSILYKISSSSFWIVFDSKESKKSLFYACLQCEKQEL